MNVNLNFVTLIAMNAIITIHLVATLALFFSFRRVFLIAILAFFAAILVFINTIMGFWPLVLLWAAMFVSCLIYLAVKAERKERYKEEEETSENDGVE